jgi:hypothetical protein
MAMQAPIESRHRRRGFTFPVVLIVVGVLLLLNYLDVLPWDMWESMWRFWPVVLILIGVDLVLGHRSWGWVAAPVALILGAGLIGGLVWNYWGWTPPASAAPVSAIRDVSDFDSISFGGSVQLFLEQGNTESLRIEAPDDLLRRITTNVDGRTLRIKENDRLSFFNFRSPWDKVKVYVTAKDIREVTLSGSGKITGANIMATSLHLTVSGSGKAELSNIDVGQLVSTIAGSGDFDVSGKVDSQEVNIAGSGKYRARELQSRVAHVSVAGSGDAEINVSEQLGVTIAGSGDIRYLGDPRIDQRIIGSGKIHKLSD